MRISTSERIAGGESSVAANGECITATAGERATSIERITAIGNAVAVEVCAVTKLVAALTNPAAPAAPAAPRRLPAAAQAAPLG